MTDNLLNENNKPDNLPEKFWDAENGSVRLEEMINSYVALERKMSGSLPSPDTEEGRHKVMRALGVPETPDDYCIDCDHGLFTPDADVNKRLHEKNMTQEQVQEVYDLAADKLVPVIGELSADFQADREVEKLINHFGGKEQWKQVSKQLMAFGRQNLAPDVFENLSSSFEGVMALHRMMKTEEPGLKKSSDAVSGQTDELELQSMMRDPRYWKDKDPAFIAKVTEGFQQRFGE